MVAVEILESADVVHGEGTEDAEGGHDDEPEGVAVLGFSDLEDSTGECEGESGAVILKRVDHSSGEACHFFSAYVHGGGGTDDGVGGVGGERDKNQNRAAENNSRGGGADLAVEENDCGHGDDDGFDEVECHGDGGAVPFKNLVGNPAREERACDSGEGHEFKSAASGGGNIGFHIKAHLILEIEDSNLIGTGSNGPGAGVGGGIEPDEGVGKDGAKRFEERNGDTIGVIEFVLDGARIAGFFRGFASGKEHEQSGGGSEDGRDTKEPAPFSCGNGQGKETESSENKGSEKADGDLAELNHEAKDSRESSAFLAGEPSCVDFDHAGATEGLEVAVEQPDHGEGSEGSSEGTKAKEKIDCDGSDGADQEGFTATDTVGK